MRPTAGNCSLSRGMGREFSPWHFRRTASGLSPASKRRPRCGRLPVAGNCSPSRGTAVTFIRRPSPRTASALSPAVADQTAKVWEAASGRELLTLKGHTAWVRSVAFSPDGQRIVTGQWGSDGQGVGCRQRPGIAHAQGPTAPIESCDLFSRWSADSHREHGSDREGVGGAKRSGTANAQSAQRCDYIGGFFAGRPADCGWELLRRTECMKRPAAGNCSRSRGDELSS